MILQIIVPSYNCSEWIGRCLSSIATQTYADYKVTVIDDGSSDPTQSEIIKEYSQKYNWNSILNVSNFGAGFNIYQAVGESFGFDDPILLVDGDDFLPNAHVFQRVAEIYEDPDVWMLWTHYTPFPYHTTLMNDQPVQVDPTTTSRTQQQSATYTDAEADTPGLFRAQPIRINHLVTFRTFLFKESVQVSDLTLENGQWLKAGYDRMIFTPMLERSGSRHIKFVPEVMYCYNSINPISDVSVRRHDGDLAHARVARIPYKQPLSDEWVANARLQATG